MPLIQLVVDQAVEKQIDQWIEKKYFNSRGEAVLYALKLLAKFINDLERKGGGPEHLPMLEFPRLEMMG